MRQPTQSVTLEDVDVECTHCGIKMASHSGGGGTILYFHCASCQRWTTSMYSEVFRADTKMRARAKSAAAPQPNVATAGRTALGTVKEHLERWLRGLEAQNPYRILGVEADSSDEQVRERYLALARQHHPDRGGQAQEMRRINDAYERIRADRHLAHAPRPAFATL